MKQLLIVTITLLAVPFLIITLTIREREEPKHIELVENKTIRVKKEEANQIVKVPLEEYIIGVVAGEMPVSFELEALKAQSVAARTYVLKKMEENKGKDYDVVDTVTHQVFKDEEQLRTVWKDSYQDNINKVKMAVLKTKGEYLTYNDEIISALFFATSNGFTENNEDVFGSDLPYLKSVESKWDEQVTNFKTTKEISLNEFYTALELPAQDSLTISEVKRSRTNRVLTLKINGQEMKGRTLYEKLKLRSTDFEINQDGKKIIFTMKGYGHGVGMSQNGANGMAKEGKKYQDILKYYYQQTKIKKIEATEV